MNAPEIVRSEEEISAMMEICITQISAGGSKWSGMTYEEGVRACLDWLIGDSDDNPMAD